MLSDNTLRLQSILLPREDVCSVEEIYYHNEDGRVLFDGYFNLFALDKWRKYTQIDNLRLHMKCSGFKAIVLMNDRKEIQHIDIDPNKGEYDVEFPYENDSYDLDFWFALIKDENFRGNSLGDIEGFFYSEINRFKKRNINIVADICTFKREEYIYRNLKQLKESIFDNSSLELNRHFNIFIVDNGNTLKECGEINRLVSSCNGKVKIYENINAGGTGGFTRGMIEAINFANDKKFSHVLLMDDDAVNEPDAIVRTYAILSTLRLEWENASIGGTMLREDFPFLLYDNGPRTIGARIVDFDGKEDLRNYEICRDKKIMEPFGEHNRYSGWWFYCTPICTIKNNLPIPFFIHMDDVEYCNRNRDYGLIFFNGISVWHRPFDIGAPSSNMYYDVRNSLIMLSVLKYINKKDMLRFMLEAVYLKIRTSLTRYRYKDIKLIYKAVKDYLEGPDKFMAADPQTVNLYVIGNSYKFENIDAYKGKLTKAEYEYLKNTIDNYGEQDAYKELFKERKTNRILYKVTLNGIMLPSNKSFEAISTILSPTELFRIKKVAFFEPYSKKVLIVKKSYFAFISSMYLTIKISLMLMLKYKKIIEEYKDAFPKMTGLDFWSKYLRLQ